MSKIEQSTLLRRNASVYHGRSNKMIITDRTLGENRQNRKILYLLIAKICPFEGVAENSLRVDEFLKLELSLNSKCSFLIINRRK